MVDNPSLEFDDPLAIKAILLNIQLSLLSWVFDAKIAGLS